MKTSIGLCGATGKTPELQIGQVKTVEHTQKASVEITGTRENPILNFNIPKGKDGAKLIVREYFNGDIQILNNLNELPQDTNSDTYGKTVMSVNGIKQLLEKISDVLTKANANTNAIGSLTSTVQGNKSDIETKLNNFKSETDTRVQSINQSISDLEGIIETKLNEELTKQVKALQDENKKLNDMIFENSLKESFEGSTSSISDTSNGVVRFETIKGQTYQNLVADGNVEKNVGISVDTNAKYIYTHDLKNNTDYTLIYTCQNISDALPTISIDSGGSGITVAKNGYNKILFNTRELTNLKSLWVYYNGGTISDIATGTIKNVMILEGDWTNKEVPSSITGIESTGEKEGNKISILSKSKNIWEVNDFDIESGNYNGVEITRLDNGFKFNGVSNGGYTFYSRTNYVNKFELGKTYTLTGEHFSFENTYTDGHKTWTRQIKYTNDLIKVICYMQWLDASIVFDNKIVTPQIEEGTQATSYAPFNQDKKEISLNLDGGLKSLPNGVCDTIEQKEDGFILVQRIEKQTYNGSENWIDLTREPSGLTRACLYQPQIKINTDMLSNRLQRVYWSSSPWLNQNECFSIEAEDGGTSHKLALYLKCDDNIDAFKQNLRDNQVTIYYELNTPVETKLDINNLNLKTFKDLTYITSENSIKPVLKGQATKDITTVIKNLQSKGAN